MTLQKFNWQVNRGGEQSKQSLNVSFCNEEKKTLLRAEKKYSLELNSLSRHGIKRTDYLAKNNKPLRDWIKIKDLVCDQELGWKRVAMKRKKKITKNIKYYKEK